MAIVGDNQNLTQFDGASPRLHIRAGQVWLPASDTPLFEPSKWIERLQAARVNYVVVGDVALEAHGVRTPGTAIDLDIVPELTESNLLRLVVTLREFGAELERGGRPIEAADDPFRTAHYVDVNNNEPLPVDLFERVGGHEGAVTFTSMFGVINVYPTPRSAPTYGALATGGTQRDVLGRRVTVASLSDVRRIKSVRGTDRDITDVIAIDEFVATLPITEPSRPSLTVVPQIDDTIGASAVDSGRRISLQEALERVKGLNRSAAAHHALSGRTVPNSTTFANRPTATERLVADISLGRLEAPVLARELEDVLRPDSASNDADGAGNDTGNLSR